MNGLGKQLEGMQDLLAIVAPGCSASALAAIGLPRDTTFHELVSPMPGPRERDAVVLVVSDLTALRRAASALGNFGASRRVAVYFENAGHVPGLAARPEWPAMDELIVRRTEDERFVLVTFQTPAQVRPVLLELARAAASGSPSPIAWPTLGARRDQPSFWPPMDPAATVAVPRRLFDSSVDSPPDLVLTDRAGEQATGFTRDEHPVLGRAPLVATMEPDLGWESAGNLGEAELLEALTRRGPRSLGPFDEGLLNPIGFERDPVGPPARLRGTASDIVTVEPADATPSFTLSVDRGISESALPALRGLPGLSLDWRATSGPQEYCRLVVSLAMAGVPLVSDEVPNWARPLLPHDVAEALEAPSPLAERMVREEHSIRLRRAALRSFGAAAWRRSLAREHGLQTADAPRVSVLLATRRPEMVPFALRQVSRQRHVDLEVVLATHGFSPDPDALSAFREVCDAPLTTFEADASTCFGEVLNQASTRAQGDVLLKMDDDDWYGPDFVSDLLMARGYSGAEVVGCPAEITFLEPLWLTTRRPDATETYRPFVAGGTILVDRSFFRALGGLRHTRKYVDANLLNATVSAGGRVYRTHGLGYVLRRRGSGHTWDPGLGYFVKRQSTVAQWRGFRPSALLEHSDIDLPVKPRDERLSP